MTDVYVYHFTRVGPAGDNLLSRRRGTLEAIRAEGEPVMESQIVVDHTEVDGHGFVIGGIGDESHPMDELWAQIRSLERRAHSRDNEALDLSESTDGERRYMLGLESRELRKQASRLTNERARSMAGELSSRIDAHRSAQSPAGEKAGLMRPTEAADCGPSSAVLQGAA